eukprot:scaffold5921_cov123-Isochrysis_galbana.AAC.4
MASALRGGEGGWEGRSRLACRATGAAICEKRGDCGWSGGALMHLPAQPALQRVSPTPTTPPAHARPRSYPPPPPAAILLRRDASLCHARRHRLSHRRVWLRPGQSPCPRHTPAPRANPTQPVAPAAVAATTLVGAPAHPPKVRAADG